MWFLYILIGVQMPSPGGTHATPCQIDRVDFLFDYTKRDFRSLMAELGLEGMTTYNCRHAFITLAITASVPQAQLMQIVSQVRLFKS